MRRWGWGPYPARINRDHRVIGMTRSDRAVFQSLYGGADEHGLFLAEEMALRAELGFMDGEPVQPAIFDAARRGLVHLYMNGGTLYGVIDRYDEDADSKTLTSRPSPSLPMPPADICREARVSGVYRGKRGEAAKTAEPDPSSTRWTPPDHTVGTASTPRSHTVDTTGPHGGNGVHTTFPHGGHRVDTTFPQDETELHDEDVSTRQQLFPPGVHRVDTTFPPGVHTGQDRTGQDTLESTLSVSNMDLTTRARMDAPEVAPAALESAHALEPPSGWARVLEENRRLERELESSSPKVSAVPPRMIKPIPVPTGPAKHSKPPRGMTVGRYETQCFDRFEQAMGMGQPGPQKLTPEQEAEEMAKLQQRIRERRVAEGRDPDTGALLEPEPDPQPPEPAA